MTAQELMRQAAMTADYYLGAAIDSIDRRLGSGYAKRNPGLVAAFISACAADFETSNETLLRAREDEQ